MAQKDYIRSLEVHYGKLAQDQKNVETVAVAIHGDAHRIRLLILEMQSEIHGLKSVRDTLAGDFENRTRQVQRLQAELEKSQPRTKG